jgi:DNA-binding response OmpR family regulator
MKGRITVIDDDADLRSLLQLTLKMKGFDVSAYANGDEFLSASRRLEPSDLYVIDINLGGITGFEICSYIKSEMHTFNPVVILISANPEVQELAKLATADDYMLKPFSQKELIERVVALMDRKH